MSRSITIITRLFVDQPLVDGANLTLGGSQGHLLRNVLRAQPGLSVGLFNGTDGEWRGEILAVAKSGVEIQLQERRRDQSSGPDVWLCFSPLKKSAVDTIATKASELGIARLRPVLTERTAVSRINTDRLRANAVEAAEQCERLDVAVIDEPMSLTTLLNDWPEDRPLIVCAEAGEARPLAEVAAEVAEQRFGLLVGPEGGFSETELDQLSSLSFVHAVGLGPLILRADTAAIAALAICMSHTRNWKNRPPNEAAFYSRTA